MMTVPDGYPTEPQIDYKLKYKALKKKLRLLVYEHECFLEELRKAQRKLLKVARDRSFLLDRLIQYEKDDDSSGDSDATASSDSDGEHRDGSQNKKRKFNSGSISVPPEFAHLVTAAALHGALQGAGGSGQDGGKKKSKSNRKSKGGGKGGKQPGQMTREELERHLDSRQSTFGLEKAPANLPMDIFNNDNSNQDSFHSSDLGMLIGDEEDDLVIDVPQ